MAINYIQRQTIGLLKSPLQHEFSLDEVGYANIVFWFQAAYALGYVSFGRVLDRIGARTGYAIAFILWNLSHMAAGLAGDYRAVHFGAGGSGPRGIGGLPVQPEGHCGLVSTTRGAPLLPASSMPARMSAPSSRRRSCR